MFTNAFRALDIQSRGRRLYVLHSCIFDTQSIISQTDSSASSKEHQSVVIGVDLAGLLGGRMASAEGGSRVERGGIWGGVSPLQPTKGSGGAS